MAQTGKENQPRTPHFLEPQQKESILLTANALSSSKIPVLAKSRLPPEAKQLQNRVQQVCLSSTKSKRVKMPKKSCTVPSPGVAALEPTAELLPQSHSRHPLGEMQLSTSGHRNISKDGVSDGKGSDDKEVAKVEFLPDADALASILSNTGLTNQTVGSAHKPSLARRVPLKGPRTCSVSSGARQGSLYKEVLTMNFTHMMQVSRVKPKAPPTDTGPSQSCGLALNGQQLMALSATLKNSGPEVMAKPNLLMENLGAGKCQDSEARSKTKCPGSVSEGRTAVSNNSAGKQENAGTSWQDEEFVPDPAAKASILSNRGLSHSALQANGKLSLAQRVPMKDSQKPFAACSSSRDGNAALLDARMSAPPSVKFGRVPCHSTQSLKGLKESAASEVQSVNTPSKRCSVLDISPYGLARRVPCPQSLVCARKLSNPWKCNRVPLSSCGKVRRAGEQCQTETPQVKWVSGLSPQTTGTVDSKQDGTAVPWEKIAVRLFQDELRTSAKRIPAAPVITQEIKLQRIEILAQLLQQEITGGVSSEAITPLKELHKLLSGHCSPAPKPDQSTTPRPDSRPNLCKPAPAPPFAEALEALSASNQQTVCPSPSVKSIQSPLPRASNTGGSGALPPLTQVRQQLGDLLQARDHFNEACLNDECAFYTARVTSVPQDSVPRCKEPVAKMLDSDDAMHFIPISVTMSKLPEAERSSPA